jgi:hypothetical protein
VVIVPLIMLGFSYDHLLVPMFSDTAPWVRTPRPQVTAR